MIFRAALEILWSNKGTGLIQGCGAGGFWVEPELKFLGPLEPEPKITARLWLQLYSYIYSEKKPELIGNFYAGATLPQNLALK